MNITNTFVSVTFGMLYCDMEIFVTGIVEL